MGSDDAAFQETKAKTAEDLIQKYQDVYSYFYLLCYFLFFLSK